MSIQVTPTSTAEVLRIKKSQNLDEKTFLRIGILGGGCSGIQYSLNFDTEFDPNTDTQYEFGDMVLVTKKKFDPHFDGTQIDFLDGPLGSGFAIDNPNFPKTGGCPGCGGH